ATLKVRMDAVQAGLFQSQPRCQAPGDCNNHQPLRWLCQVSISTEMPGPWRRSLLTGQSKLCPAFQSQPRCQAPGDPMVASATARNEVFQSQPRCQAPGDYDASHQRQVVFENFNLNRDARPLATDLYSVIKESVVIVSNHKK